MRIMFPETGYGPTWPEEYRTELAASNERSVAETARVAALASTGFLAGSLGALTVWELVPPTPAGAALAIGSGAAVGVGVPAMLDALGRSARRRGGAARHRLARAMDRARRRRPRNPPSGTESGSRPSLLTRLRTGTTHRPRR